MKLHVHISIPTIVVDSKHRIFCKCIGKDAVNNAKLIVNCVNRTNEDFQRAARLFRRLFRNAKPK